METQNNKKIYDSDETSHNNYRKNRICKFVFYSISSAIAVFLMISIFVISGFVSIKNNEVVPVLMYHNVVEKPVAKRISYSIRKDNFDAHMKMLKDRGYTPILISDLEKSIYEDKPLPSKPVMITFDDGKYNNYKNAYPIMIKHGMKGNIFVIGKTLDKNNKHHRSVVYNSQKSENEYKYTVNEKDITEMQNSGLFEFGSHTYSLHSKLDSIPILIHKYRNKEKEDVNHLNKVSDLEKSKEILENIVKTDVSSIAYPYGGYDEETLEIIQELDFKLGFTTDNGVYRKGDNPYKINRINVDGLCSRYRLILEIEMLKLLSMLRNIK